MPMNNQTFKANGNFYTFFVFFFFRILICVICTNIECAIAIRLPVPANCDYCVLCAVCCVRWSATLNIERIKQNSENLCCDRNIFHSFHIYYFELRTSNQHAVHTFSFSYVTFCVWFLFSFSIVVFEVICCWISWTIFDSCYNSCDTHYV